jgi:formylglycine-generating enzyme required for sulfatase activity
VYALALPPAARAAALGALRAAPWWLSVPGASWRAPAGPHAAAAATAAPPAAPRHPVVHVSHADAAAFCAAAGKRLPSEREWEYAARGGLHGARFTWGDDGDAATVAARARTFAGHFPWRPAAGPRGVGVTAVRSHPPNGFGLYDMAGNAWEWCADELAGGRRRPQRGGSAMCHRDGCFRYRVSARLEQTPESTASHVGFRCAADAGSAAHGECVSPPPLPRV